MEKEVYPAGSVHHLRRGVVKQYKMPDTCWALEYAAGESRPFRDIANADCNL